MYLLNDYARMIADGTRMDAYVGALEGSVRSGSVVVDMGTGTGILALVACRLGARRVYAVDKNDAIEVARELARENGCADRIVFIQEDVRRVKLPERADLVVSAMQGGLPLAGANLEAAVYARENFLAPGGVFIPAVETLMAAVVGSSALYERAVGKATSGGVTLRAMHEHLSNSVHRDRTRSVRPQDLLTLGAAWATLDYSAAKPSAIHGRVEWRAERTAEAHGIALWFDSVLVGQYRFSTAPGVDGVHPQLFLPWPDPVSLEEGDSVNVDLWAQPGGEAWGWNTVITGARGATRARFKQSSLMAALTPPGRSESHVTPPGEAS